MSDAVAKLRFDLLANVAGMTGPLDQASQASEKMAQRFNRSFDSVKQSAARAEKEMQAWKQAMQGEGSFLASAQKEFSAGPLAQAKARQPLDQAIPWGDGFRKELSRQAAETAALAGKEGAKLSGILGAGLKLAGPLAAIGGAGFAVYHELSQRSDEMRDRAHAAIHGSQVMGTDVESASRLQAVGFDEEAGARFQRSLHDNPDAFKNLGLDARKLQAEPLTQALDEVGKALKNTSSAAARDAAAMDIFGKSGAELLPILSGLKRKLDDVSESAVVTAEKALRTKNFDATERETNRVFEEGEDRFARGLGADEGFGSAWQHAKGVLGADFFGGRGGREEYEERLQAAKDRNAKAAEDEKARPQLEAAARQQAERRSAEAERQKKLAEANQAIAEMAEASQAGSIRARRSDQYGNDFSGIIAGVQKLGLAAGWSNNDIGREIASQEQNLRAGQLAGQAVALGSHRTASEQYEEDSRSIEEYRQHVAGAGGLSVDRMAKQRDKSYAAALGIQNPEEEYADKMTELLQARGKFSAEKIQRAAASAADALTAAVDEPFMTAIEKFEAHMKGIDAGEKSGAYTADQARRRREAETESELSHAGIKRPLDDFKKSIEEIDRLKNGGTISPEEAGRRERELRRQAIAGQLDGIEEIHATAAVGAGSREAYSAQVNAQLNDPRTQIAIETNKKLDELVKAAQEAADKARPIVAEAAAPF